MESNRIFLIVATFSLIIYGVSTQQYGQDPSYNQYNVQNSQDNCCQDYCYSTDENPYLGFSSKTTYQIVYGKRSNQHIVPECTPIQFWSLNRDGASYPTANQIHRYRELKKIHDEIIKNYEERKSYPDNGRLCQQDFELLKRWHWNESITEFNANALTSQGIEDMKFLARRYRTRFGNLLQPSSSNEKYYNFMFSSNGPRTHDSYQAYIEGLFGNEAYKIHANVNPNENFQTTGSKCRAWSEETDDNNNTYTEYARFKTRPEYQEMVRSVFKRLGFRYTLNEAIISDMYDVCRYEKAWNINALSPWCAAFNKDQLKILEYAHDLADYYYSGYGNEMSTKIGCSLVKDLYETFEKTIRDGANDFNNRVNAYFTHSTMIETFLTALGVGKDNIPLTADNYFQQGKRNWKVTQLNPFSANVVAVLYQCLRGQKYKVMFFLNESPIDFPECSVGLCDWSTVLEKVKSVADNCNTEFCEKGSSSIPQIAILTIISMLGIRFM